MASNLRAMDHFFLHELKITLSFKDGRGQTCETLCRLVSVCEGRRSKQLKPRCPYECLLCRTVWKPAGQRMKCCSCLPAEAGTERGYIFCNMHLRGHLQDTFPYLIAMASNRLVMASNLLERTPFRMSWTVQTQFPNGANTSLRFLVPLSNPNDACHCS